MSKEVPIVKTLKKALKICQKKGWPKLYWAIDLHDTIIPRHKSKGVEIKKFFPYAKECLKIITSRPDMCFILFTSTYPSVITEIDEWFDEFDITADYLNHNPECNSNDYADFSNKFYYDVLLDDKAGFDPHTDWEHIYYWLALINKEGIL